MSSPTASGRRRGIAKQLSTEDQALNMIAREAEARLAAKRAARAEARSIRMKELEKAQQQADENAEKEIEQSGDEKVQRKKSVAATKLTSGFIDEDKPLNEAALSSVIDSQSDEYKHLRENIRLLDVKYRKAMVSMAQLDNERQALQYTVECLKDQVEDQEETTENLKDELDHKNREYNKLSIEHRNTVAELNQMRIVLQDRERILDEHGINLDGTLREDPKADESIEKEQQNHLVNGFVDEGERDTLLDQIKSLKEEVAQLRKENTEETEVRGKRTNDPRQTQHQRNTADHPDGADSDRSYADVSDEAQEIQSSPSTIYINNNEKNDDFEVIDDGSQQMRNFEDMSYEKSGRSSMLSSMITESNESEKPLEISYGKVLSEQRQQDEFEMIHSGYSPMHARTNIKGGSEASVSEPRQLNVSQLVVSTDMGSHSPSPLPSDININKYLLSDDDSNGEQNSPVETFSVDRYFATSYSTHDEDDSASATTDTASGTTGSTRHSRADMPTVTLDNFDSGATSTDPTTEETPIPPSPSQSSTDLSDPRRNTYISALDDVLPDDEIDGDIDPSDPSFDNAFMAEQEDEKPLYVSQQLNYDNTYNDAQLSLDLQASSPPVPVAYGYTKQSQIQSVATSSAEPSKPQILASGKFEQPKADTRRMVSTDSEGDKVMRQDLEALYEEVSHSISTEDIRTNSREEETPTETYGMFVIPEQRHEANEHSNEAVFAVTGHANVPPSEDNSNDPEGKPKPWLVRVESFTTPEATLQTPQIVKSAEPEENLPVPKERKKKKKTKKKDKHQEISQAPSSGTQISTAPLPGTHIANPPMSASTDSLPREPESPSPQLVSAPSSPTQERPPNGQQQSLTVEQSMEAYSDYSDNEGAEGDKKRTSSKKKDKKEGCKTQ